MRYPTDSRHSTHLPQAGEAKRRNCLFGLVPRRKLNALQSKAGAGPLLSATMDTEIFLKVQPQPLTRRELPNRKTHPRIILRTHCRPSVQAESTKSETNHPPGAQLPHSPDQDAATDGPVT
jgi:hypothetical protein